MNVQFSTRGNFFLLTLLAIASLAALTSSAKAEMQAFWNFDSSSTSGDKSYVTDSVVSERLELIDATIVDGKLTAQGGYACGTGDNFGVSSNIALPTGTSSTPNYTMSAWFATTKNTNDGVGIMGWGNTGNYLANCFRTYGQGFRSYWWSADATVTGYPEVTSGYENSVITTAEGTTHYIYLNGQLINTTSTHARNESNTNFAVGNTVNNNKEMLYGTIDNASLYNECLSHADIVVLATSMVNGMTNWWKSGTNVDRISGIVNPASASGETVLNGANGDVMVFNHVLEAGERAFYQGQMATGHDFVVDNLAGSEAGKTTWLKTASANLADMTTAPLGLYVGGTTTATTLTATAEQINSVNRTLVLGGGTLAIESNSDVSIDINKLSFDSGNITTSGSGKLTINTVENLSFKTVTLGSSLTLNSSGDMRILGALSGAGNLEISGSSTMRLLSSGNGSFTGKVIVNDGSELIFTKQDTFANAHNNCPTSFVVDGGKISNEGTVYNYLQNATFKDGAELYVRDGNATWKGFKLYKVNVVRNDDDSAAAPVTFAADMTKPNAVIAFGERSDYVASGLATLNVQDITSPSGGQDNLPDLVISCIIEDTVTNSNGTRTTGPIEKTGNGCLELAAKNIFTGKFTISQGAVLLSAEDAMAHSKYVVNNGTIMGTANQTLNNLSGSGDIVFDGESALTLTNSAATTYTGSISGVNVLKAEGVRALDLSNATVSAANFAATRDTSVKVSSAKPITVTESFQQDTDAQFNFSGGNAQISGDNVASQATITLNGGTMSFNGFKAATATLPNYGGLALHLDASDASSITVDTNGNITAWKNLANNSNSLTGVSTNKATVTQDLKNGLNVVTFPSDGSANYNLASSISGQTFFAVMADYGNTPYNGYSFLFGDTGSYNVHRGTETQLFTANWTNANLKNGVTTINGETIAAFDIADIGTDWTVLSMQATGGVAFNAISRDRSIANRGWHGDVAEILVYTTQLTDEQVQAVSEYLATKWQVGADVLPPTLVTTGAFETANTLVVAEDSTIDVGAFDTVTFGDVTLNSGKTLTFNVDGGQQTLWNSKFSGDGNIVKTGSGTLQFYGEDANAIVVSNTTVSEGRMDIKGWLTSGLKLESGATFSPGNSVGTLDLTGNFTMDPGSTLLMEIGGTGVDENDQLIVNGDLSLAEGAVINLVLADPSSLGPGDTFTAILSGNNSASFEDSLIDSFVKSYYFTDLAYVPYGEGLYAITGRVDPNAVPEPSTWALLILGAAGLYFIRRNKTKK